MLSQFLQQGWVEPQADWGVTYLLHSEEDNAPRREQGRREQL